MSAEAPTPTQGPGRGFRAGLWRLADPKISLASMASIFLGLSAAGAEGAVDPLWAALTIAGIFLLEVAKNASGEIFDYESGTDLALRPEERSPFSGGKRVLVDGLLSRRETAWIAAVAYGGGIAAGLLIAALREPGVLGLGLAGVALAYLYHAPPLRLSYRGLGEVAVGIAYGPLICAGTYLVQRGTVTAEVLWISLPLGLLIADFLLINEFPDARADAGAAKKTLVVRWGRRGGAGAYAAAAGAALLLLACLPLLGVPVAVWAGGVFAAPSAFAAYRLLRRPRDVAWIVPAQAASLGAFLLYAVAGGLGLLMAG